MRSSVGSRAHKKRPRSAFVFISAEWFATQRKPLPPLQSH